MAAAVAAASLALAPASAGSQVIELGRGGAMAVYERPSTFDGEGSHPIAPGIVASPVTPAMRPLKDRREIAQAAKAADLSSDLIVAVALQESGMRAAAISSKGAVGQMQLMPETARSLGVDPKQTDQNYRGGGAYLRRLLQRYRGDVVLTLAAYNAGPAAVDRYGGVPPYKETQAYVAAVLERLSRLADDHLTSR